MRFIHTSDWHLGRIFYGEHLTADQSYVLHNFLDLVADVCPQAVLIAGDIYDRAVPPVEAVELLNEILGRLTIDLRVPVIMIAGNHDSPERVGFGNRLLAKQGLHVIGSLGKTVFPIVLEDEFGPVHFVPITYAEPSVVKVTHGIDEMMNHEQAMQYLVQRAITAIPPGQRSVALAHAYIAGSEDSESERPLTVGGSGTVSYDIFRPFHYTALGHLHKAQRAGTENIRYSGSLLKYSFSETGQQKGVYLIDMDRTGNTETQFVTLKPRRDVRCIEGYMQDLLAVPNQVIGRDDYIMANLLDEQPVLDPMGRLRQIYPNILGANRQSIAVATELDGPEGDHRTLSEQELFRSFFEQITGRSLSAQENTVFCRVVEDVFRASQEAGKR
ncbi:MAG: metallophosphatase [Firmicutes bacterium]|nr:metallophosphatase [Bacillota bacterium]